MFTNGGFTSAKRTRRRGRSQLKDALLSPSWSAYQLGSSWIKLLTGI